ncbi:hypothetical protein E2C01_099576 [Portunus trituberculatus]|uniref:Uncharacterized protein n=1 Tax=Portunus trituberculatus TaxID=210409 RepID=A0A5B7KFB7_PORTR|nr:hypothetical protein [Portunus trituberculatus]
MMEKNVMIFVQLEGGSLGAGWRLAGGWTAER